MRKKIAVYCSSRSDIGDELTRQSLKVAEAIGTLGCGMVYGGVDAGLMHLVARRAHDSGAEITGIVPEIFMHRADNICDKLVFTSGISERKEKMITLADIFIVLPGGIGTLDEWISTLADIMVREKGDLYDDKPILVLNIDGIYDCMVSQLKSTAGSVFAHGKHLDRSRIFTDAESLIAELVRLVE